MEEISISTYSILVKNTKKQRKKLKKIFKCLRKILS